MIDVVEKVIERHPEVKNEGIPEHRSYWLLHMSKHPLARDVMGQQHWDLRNHFIHHGPSGLKMPGFNPEIDPTQGFFNFNFDDDADQLAKVTLLEEVPAALFEAHRGDDRGLSITKFYENYCEFMPGTFVHLSSTILRLREEGEVQILDQHGKLRPRAGILNWRDRIVPVRQPTLFSRLKPKD